jgi:membrane protein implicated in regulation of membrane protease activity
MKTLIVSFAIWIFLVPVAVAMFLISAAVAVRTPDLYFTFTALALTLSILAMVSGRAWLEPFLNANVRLFPKTQQHTNSIQEIKHEKSLEGRIRS